MSQPYYPSLNRPTDGYLFVVTYGLSGDVALQSVLNAIPGLCIRGENAETGGLLAEAWAALESVDPATPDGFMRDTRLGWALADAFTETVLSPPKGVRVAGFREIRWPEDPVRFAQRLDFLYSFFPGTRFVFNTRNHADVAASGWWAQQDPEQVAAQLRKQDENFDAYVQRWPGRGVRVHFDDYASDPAVLTDLFKSLDADADIQGLHQKLRDAVAGMA